MGQGWPSKQIGLLNKGKADDLIRILLESEDYEFFSPTVWQGTAILKVLNDSFRNLSLEKRS